MKEHNMKKRFVWFVAVITLLILMAGNALAHGVTVFAWVEGDTVFTESKFAGGRKAKNAPIEVYDAAGNKLLEGKTNDNGEFSFKVPKKTDLTVVLLAGMGHKGQWTVSAEEITGIKAEPMEPMPQEKQEVDVITEPEDKETTGTLNVNQGDIELAVEKALEKKMAPLLDKKLHPVLKMLRESQQKNITISDILGGLGYILGLVGIGAYVGYRRKT